MGHNIKIMLDLSKKYNENDEKDNDCRENLDHEPPV